MVRFKRKSSGKRRAKPMPSVGPPEEKGVKKARSLEKVLDFVSTLDPPEYLRTGGKSQKRRRSGSSSAKRKPKKQRASKPPRVVDSALIANIMERAKETLPTGFAIHGALQGDVLHARKCDAFESMAHFDECARLVWERATAFAHCLSSGVNDAPLEWCELSDGVRPGKDWMTRLLEDALKRSKGGHKYGVDYPPPGAVRPEGATWNYAMGGWEYSSTVQHEWAQSAQQRA